jgi:AFG3 family protein
MSKDNSTNDNRPGGGSKFGSYWIYGLVALFFLGINIFSFSGHSEEISRDKLANYIQNGHIEKVVVLTNRPEAQVYIKEASLAGEEFKKVAKTPFKTKNKGPHYFIKFASAQKFEEDLEAMNASLSLDKRVPVEYDEASNLLPTLIGWLLPFLLLIGIWVFIMRRVGGGGAGPGSQIFNIGKSKATLFDKDGRVNVTFQDVAGLDEAKEEVMEVVDFLKNPKKYTALGGKIPKGVLLVGSPGTGKTLLAKAVAGEAGVPFFTISGSDFVEMFVGVGASRVRDLFRQAREKAPCIVFIDEIDAIGRARGRNAFHGNDERENTLNQLLVEMDGFSTDKGVIMMAATNRPDILDSALLRPGRFDRMISIDKPDLVGREQIFQVHLKPLKIDDTVDAKVLSLQTPGFAGADIANVCNEAALIAARRNKQSIGMDDFNDAIDRAIGGLEKKNKIISPEEKRVIAYHEAGHAICGWYLEYASPLVKVTIVPRGIGTLGYAQYLPKEQFITTTEQMLDQVCMTLGGRAAEANTFGAISTGAQSDLDYVTKISYAMIAHYGMNEKVGNVSFYDMMEQQMQRPYSDETARLIDDEARKLIDTQYVRARQVLREKSRELELLANELLNKEVLSKSDVERLIGKRPFDEVPDVNGEKAVGENHGVDTLHDRAHDVDLAPEETEE